MASKSEVVTDFVTPDRQLSASAKTESLLLSLVMRAPAMVLIDVWYRGLEAVFGFRAATWLTSNVKIDPLLTPPSHVYYVSQAVGPLALLMLLSEDSVLCRLYRELLFPVVLVQIADRLSLNYVASVLPSVDSSQFSEELTSVVPYLISLLVLLFIACRIDVHWPARLTVIVHFCYIALVGNVATSTSDAIVVVPDMTLAWITWSISAVRWVTFAVLACYFFVLLIRVTWSLGGIGAMVDPKQFRSPLFSLIAVNAIKVCLEHGSSMTSVMDFCNDSIVQSPIEFFATCVVCSDLMRTCCRRMLADFAPITVGNGRRIETALLPVLTFSVVIVVQLEIWSDQVGGQLADFKSSLTFSRYAGGVVVAIYFISTFISVVNLESNGDKRPPATRLTVVLCLLTVAPVVFLTVLRLLFGADKITAVSIALPTFMIWGTEAASLVFGVIWTLKNDDKLSDIPSSHRLELIAYIITDVLQTGFVYYFLLPHLNVFSCTNRYANFVAWLSINYLINGVKAVVLGRRFKAEIVNRQQCARIPLNLFQYQV